MFIPLSVTDANNIRNVYALAVFVAVNNVVNHEVDGVLIAVLGCDFVAVAECACVHFVPSFPSI